MGNCGCKKTEVKQRVRKGIVGSGSKAKIVAESILKGDVNESLLGMGAALAASDLRGLASASIATKTLNSGESITLLCSGVKYVIMCNGRGITVNDSRGRVLRVQGVKPSNQMARTADISLFVDKGDKGEVEEDI